jgi:hypothetical protein
MATAGAEITAFEPNRRFATQTVTEPPVTASYDFEVADGGARLTYTFVMLTRAVKAAKAFAVDYGAKWKAAAKVIPTLPLSAQLSAVPRSSERPATRRGHCAIGRPSRRNCPLIGVPLPNDCGQPSGESSQGSWRP